MYKVCYNCKERHEACHDNCKKYKEWKQQEQEKREQINSARKEYLFTHGFMSR